MAVCFAYINQEKKGRDEKWIRAGCVWRSHEKSFHVFICSLYLALIHFPSSSSRNAHSFI